MSPLPSTAAGCWIVSSDYAVLPETTVGVARLLPYSDDGDIRVYANAFVDAALDGLARWIVAQHSDPLSGNSR